jgi:hypothetical protein
MSTVLFFICQSLVLFSLLIYTQAHSNLTFPSKKWTLDKRLPGFGFEILFAKRSLSDPSQTHGLGHVWVGFNLWAEKKRGIHSAWRFPHMLWSETGPRNCSRNSWRFFSTELTSEGHCTPVWANCVLPSALWSSKSHVPWNWCDFNCPLAKYFTWINSENVVPNHEFYKRPFFRESRRFLGKGWRPRNQGSLPCWGRRFKSSPKTSIPVLGSTQPPTQWIFGGSFPRKLCSQLHLLQKLRIRGVIPPLPSTTLYVFKSSFVTKFWRDLKPSI